MSQVTRRIADLSPERRRLLDRLLATSRAQAPAQSGAQDVVLPEQRKLFEPLLASHEPPPAMDQEAIAGDSAGPPGDGVDSARGLTPFSQDVRSLYETVNQQLNIGPLGRYSRFLNLGYASDGSPEHAQVELPQYRLNKNSIKLVLEVVGDCDLTDRRVLDVGCGRGGTVEVIAEYFQPARLVGLDLSLAAMSFCRGMNRHAHAAFLQGDAQNLPFRSQSFDALTNIESSHNYPSIFAFYAEVARLLRVDGCFLYSDLIPRDLSDAYLSCLSNVGLGLEVERDITPNVLLSCREIAATRLRAFDDHNDRQAMSDFLGVPGSGIYNSMATGQAQFRIFRFRKA